MFEIIKEAVAERDLRFVGEVDPNVFDQEITIALGTDRRTWRLITSPSSLVSLPSLAE